MAKRKRQTQPEARRPDDLTDGQRTRQSHGKEIRTHAIGALPILNQLLARMQLQERLGKFLPPEDGRTKIDTPRIVLLLVRNLLVSREPMYGVGEWAQNFGPEQFDFCPDDLAHLNDDRVGRCLERVCGALETNLILDVVTHVVREFGVGLDELHNDSTTVSFYGDYPEADREQLLGRLLVPAITFGHSKDHRPDLKQLLYILTVSDDGGVPLYFQTASGNQVDDQTHIATWTIMAELVGKPDFVYVADCKLATTENLQHIARHGGRFVTVLPASRKEDREFRERLRSTSLAWREIDRTTYEDGSPRDELSVCEDEQLTKEGFRLWWFHSRSKAESDGERRAQRVQRAIQELTELNDRLRGPRTRFRQREQVAEAVEAILQNREASDFLRVEIVQRDEETYRQAKRGRPTAETPYKREVKTRFELSWEIRLPALAEAARGDGVFPLVTNLEDWSALEVLRAYKRQPIIEKRFSQLKTDFQVAPVYLKSVKRIVGLLAVYFFALMLQSLLERELRAAMARRRVESLPLYPEGRPCTRPTTRQVLNVFEPISRHTLINLSNPDEIEPFSTELAGIHQQLLDLLQVPLTEYDA